MTAVTVVPEEILYLPALVDLASAALAGARDAAEVLEARDMAAFAYDIAKRSARLQKAKQAHDDLIAAAHRAQAHALEIEAQAKYRLADEYDAAQKRGEVAGNGQRGKAVPDEKSFSLPTSSELGLSHKESRAARPALRRGHTQSRRSLFGHDGPCRSRRIRSDLSGVPA